MERFEKICLLKWFKMDLKDLEKYHLDLRKYKYENNIPMKNIKTRNFFHTPLVKVVMLDRLASKEKLVVLSDERENRKGKNPKIFACSHIGGKDIERAFEAFKDPAYLLFGDPGEVYRNEVGLILFLNGGINVETRNKEDRKIAKARCLEVLNNGGNLLIYPEGAWNITDNLPVMKFYTGAVDMAIQTGAEIIPIGMEQYDDTYYVRIGKEISYKGHTLDEKRELTDELRDTIATLKWRIWESFPSVDRADINEEYREKFAQFIVDKCALGYTVQDVIDTRFHDKNVTEPEEVYAPVRKLTPNKNNAFLFNKNLKG